MNPPLEKLYQIAQKESRIILGLMSGTSLDGLDLALCQFSGFGKNTQFQLLHFKTKSYSLEEQQILREVLSKSEVSLEKLTLINAWFGRLTAKIINETLQEWGITPKAVDAIASHGQTIFHAPKSQHQQKGFPNATLQIGDGDHIAQLIGILTLSDFRQKHIAIGGEGAPLVVYGDALLFSSDTENRVLLNIGGISNFTFLPKGQNTSGIWATDTGPGNTLIDLAVRYFYPDKKFDENGEIARRGLVNPKWVQSWQQHPFFKQDFPKSTGLEVFNADFLKEYTPNWQKENPENLIASLTHFTIESIAEAIELQAPLQSKIYLSGGGSQNDELVKSLQERLENYPIALSDELGIHSDAKEAILFALLANETLAGEGLALNGLPPVRMGKFSFPD